MAKSKLVKINQEISKGAAAGFDKIQKTTTGAFEKVSDKFIDLYLTKDGESISDAKKRLAKEQTQRQLEHETQMREAQKEADRQSRDHL